MSDLSNTKNLQNDNSGKESNVYVMLKIGKEYYAINVMNVTMISSTTDFRSIPNSENFIAGVMNIQGAIIPVIDMRKKFKIEDQEFTKTTAVVIVNVRNNMAGLIVDSVSDVVNFDLSEIQMKSNVLSKQDNCITGAVEFKDKIILFLNPDEIVHEDAFKELNNINLS